MPSEKLRGALMIAVALLALSGIFVGVGGASGAEVTTQGHGHGPGHGEGPPCEEGHQDGEGRGCGHQRNAQAKQSVRQSTLVRQPV
jgi:hypothetical protein